MAIDAGTLEIKMMMGLARLSQDVTGAKSMIAGMSRDISSSVALAKSALATLGVGLSVGALVLFGKHTLDAIAGMKDLGQEAGTTASAISKFEAPARMAGLGLESVAGAIFKMSKAALESKDPSSRAAQALNAIGISTAQLKGLKPDEMFELVARALGGYSDGLSKNNIMQELFGKSGREMNRVMAEIAQNGKLVATVTNEQAEAADRLQDQMVELKMNSEKFWRGIVAEGVPAMNDMLKAFIEGRKEGNLYAGMVDAVSVAFDKMFGKTPQMQLALVNDEIQAHKMSVKDMDALWAKLGMKINPEGQLAQAKAMNELLARRAGIEKQIWDAEFAAQTKRAITGQKPGKPDPKFDPAAMTAAMKEEQRLRDVGEKGWIAYIDTTTAEYEDGLREMAKISDDFWKNEERLRKQGDDGWVRSIEAQIEEYEAGLKAMGGMHKSHSEEVDEDRKRNAGRQIGQYAEIAGAAKQFFAEGSRGYKALEAAEKTFQAFQLASDLVKGVSAAAVAIANQAQGDPYTAWARMALMAAAMAALGFVVGGGGGGGAAHVAGSVERQRAQGTGTVFGDASAKSESIAHAMEILRDNSSSDLLYTSRMLTALLNIESSMSGMAAAVVRSQLTGAGVKLPGAGGGNAFSLDNAGIILGRAMNSGSSEPDQPYSGQTVAQLISGAIVTGFTDIARAHTGTFQGSSYTAVNREQSLLSQEDALVQAIGRTVQGISGAIGEAVVVLTKGAMSLEEVNAILADVHIDPMSISFADLSGDALVEALSSVFSALGDTMVSSILVPGNIEALEDFQRVGEGAFETLIRVASGVERATAQLDLWGISIIDWHDIVNTQGDVATELIRGSIVRAQTAADGVTSAIGQLVKSFDGSVDDIIGLYKTLLKLSVGLRATAIDTGLLNQAMITAAGGLALLQSGIDAYSEGFFTAEERAAAATFELTTAFAAFGAQLPATRDAFRAMVEAATAAGDSALIGRLMALAPAFANLVPAITAAVTGAAAGPTSPYGPYGPTELEMWTMPEAVAARAAAASLANALEDARASLKDWAQGLLTGPESPLDPITKMAIAQAEYAKALKDGTNQEFQDAADLMLDLGVDFWSQSGPEFLEMFNRVIADSQAKGGFTLGGTSSAPSQSSDITSLREALVAELDRARAATEAARTAIANASERAAEDSRLNREALERTGEQIARDVGNRITSAL